MNVVYFGTDVFLSCFEYFLKRHRVLALYTYHNDEDYFTEYAIVRRARQMGIPVHYEDIAPEEIERLFRREGCGLLFIAEYNRILPIPEGLDNFRGINTHSSLLPDGRSYYPIEGAMDRRLGVTGVTMHKVTSRLDGGDILAQRTVEITGETDSVDLYLKCAAAARDMLETIMSDLDGAWARAVPQAGRTPYWRRPETERLSLDHSQTTAQAAQVFRRYNSLSQARLGGRWYYVTALTPGTAPMEEQERQLSQGRWLYRTADGHLRLCVRLMPEKEDTR